MKFDWKSHCEKVIESPEPDIKKINQRAKEWKDAAASNFDAYRERAWESQKRYNAKVKAEIKELKEARAIQDYKNSIVSNFSIEEYMDYILDLFYRFKDLIKEDISSDETFDIYLKLKLDISCKITPELFYLWQKLEIKYKEFLRGENETK